MGIIEQMIAAKPLETYISAQPTTLMPSVTMNSPAMA